VAITITVLDDFNRANSPSLGGTWANDTIGAGGDTFSIVSNAVEANNSAYCEQYYTAATPGIDEGGGVTVVALPSGSGWSCGGMCRLQTPGSAACDGYRWQIDASNASVIRVVNGAETVISSAAHTAQAGDRFFLIATGAGATVTLKLYRIRSSVETEIVSTTDTNAARITTAGQISLWAYDPSSTGIFDDFGKASGSGDATVVAVPADASGDCRNPVVSNGSQTVVAVPADATADCRNPVVTGSGGTATVNAVPADLSMDLIANFPVSVSVGAAVADATGDVRPPTVSATGGATVVAVVADATGDLRNPTVTASSNATVTAVLADAVGDTRNPTISAGSTVAAVKADAIGDLLTPTISGTVSSTVTAVPADASGDLLAPQANNISAYAVKVLSRNPLRYFRLGDTTGTVAADSSTNNVNGAFVSTVTKGVAGAIFGDSNTACTNFGPVSTPTRYITAGGAPIVANLPQFSIEMWMKIPVGSVDTNAFAYAESRTTTTVPLVAVGTSLGRPILFCRPDAGGAPEGIVQPTGLINDGAWHHIVAVRETGVAGITRVYVDGIEAATSTFPVGAFTIDRITIGARRTTTVTNGFIPTATLDEVALYGTALSPSQVLEHYNAGLGQLAEVPDDDILSGIIVAVSVGNPQAEIDERPHVVEIDESFSTVQVTTFPGLQATITEIPGLHGEVE
jgi:hypothetical protein